MYLIHLLHVNFDVSWVSNFVLIPFLQVHLTEGTCVFLPISPQ